MEIKIDKIGSNNYYSEVLSVMSNYKKLCKNPRQKVSGLTTQAYTLAAFSAVFLVFFLILYLQNMSDSLYFYVVVLFTVTSILAIIYIFLIYRRISALKNISSDKRLIIEEDYVEMVVGDEKSRLAMSEILCIIINRYSISFLPKDISSKLIAVDKEYMNQVTESIGDKNLIIDNSDLY